MIYFFAEIGKNVTLSDFAVLLDYGRTTPQKDYAVITQSIGRIARVHEGKAEPIAYDFVDNIAYLVKSYKKRCTTYRKNGCYFVEEGGAT